MTDTSRLEAEIEAAAPGRSLRAGGVIRGPRPFMYGERLEEVLVERDQARALISVLEERIRKVREICGEIECPNCDHPVRFHDNRLGTCEANFNNALGPCGCDWSSSVAEDILAALDGEDEERR